MLTEIVTAETLVTPNSFNDNSNDAFSSLNTNQKAATLTADSFDIGNCSFGELDNDHPSVFLSGALTGDFPNPVKDLGTLSGLQVNGTTTLFTGEGKLLKKQTISTQNITLDMYDLPVEYSSNNNGHFK